MLTDIAASTNLSGYQVDLEWSWLDPADRPSLVLVRRTRAHAKYSSSLIRQQELESNGLILLDVNELLDPSHYWAKNQRHVYLGRNDSLESNLPLAEFSLRYSLISEPETIENESPVEITIGYYDFATRIYNRVELTDVTLVNFYQLNQPDWDSVIRWEIFHAPGGGPVESAGLIEIYQGHIDGSLSNRFIWIPAAGSQELIEFEHAREQDTELSLTEISDPNSGDWQRNYTIKDKSLLPEEIYYYRLYLKEGSNFLSTKHHWVSNATASRDYNFSDQIYQQLPAVHQQYDEPEHSDRGRGQLRRFLSLAGASFDHHRSLVELSRERHNTKKVYSKALPSLAKMIGWQPDITSDDLLLRKDIEDAPDIYQTVGTVDNLRSVVNRITRWDCKVKEFVHNVFLTNAPEKIRLWEIWSQVHDGVDWLSPEQITETDGMDGYPSITTDSSSNSWLFYHSDKSGSRQIMRKLLGASINPSNQVVLRNLEEREASDDINDYPTSVVDGDRVWLFWSSNRNGVWDIWGSWSRSSEPFSTGPDASELTQSTPRNLSDHNANDQHPVAITNTLGHIHLFWQSNRRGPTDIWSRTFDGSTWSLSTRITTAVNRHLSPSVTIDADDRLWLFYCHDQGDKINIELKVNIAGSWLEESFVITNTEAKNESPTAVFWNGDIHLFWHSNLNGRWQIFSQSMSWLVDQPSLGTVEVLTDEVTHDKEPLAYVDSVTNQLHLFWRSQRRGPDYQSRTIDTTDAKMIAELRTFQDKSHYTYDTGKNNDDYYARDTVGVFLTPNPEFPDLDDRNRRLFSGPLKEFVPINIRAVLFILPEVHREYVYTYDFPEVTPQRYIGETYSRVSTRINDETYSGVTDSYADTINDWTWIRTWSETYTDHLTVDTETLPVDIHFRTWHIGVSEGE